MKCNVCGEDTLAGTVKMWIGIPNSILCEECYKNRYKTRMVCQECGTEYLEYYWVAKRERFHLCGECIVSEIQEAGPITFGKEE